MKRLLIALAAVVLVASGCAEDEKQTERERIQIQCSDKGGIYFEYESTSAGAHIWCINEEGKDVSPNLNNEGDD